VTEALLKNGWRVRLITRSSEIACEPDSNVEWVSGNVLDRASMANAAEGCDAVIHLVGIIKESPRKGITFDSVHVTGTQNVVDAAKSAGVDTFVQMSANGAAKDGRTAYQTTKWQAEQIVKRSNFRRWSIFRPSLIFGKPVSGAVEFATQVRDTLIKPFPVWPIPGRGDYRLQPIAVKDIANAFAEAISRDELPNDVYCAGGPRTFSYLEILDLIATGSGQKVRPKLYQPIWAMRPTVSLLAPTGLLPITPAQLELLIGGNTCESSAFQDLFGANLTPFNEETLSYLREE